MDQLIVGAAAEKAVEMVVSAVYRKLSSIRANRFYAGLIQGMKSGSVTDADAATAIHAAMNSDSKAEVVFEAYRRVCLSASRNIGPTLIGLMTARALAEDRYLTEYEERIMMAAEALTDPELKSLDGFLQGAAKKVAQSSTNTIFVHDVEEHSDSNWPQEYEIGPLDLAEVFGVWASKCSTLGIVKQRMSTTQKTYREDGESFIDDPGITTTYTWRVGVEREFVDLSPLLSAAVSAAPQEGDAKSDS